MSEPTQAEVIATLVTSMRLKMEPYDIELVHDLLTAVNAIVLAGRTGGERDSALERIVVTREINVFRQLLAAQFSESWAG